MKQLLFTFLLLPFYCHAQLEAGINWGLVPYDGRESAGAKLKSGHCYDISLSYRFLHALRLGVGYNAATLPVRSSSLYYAKPLSSIYLFADHEVEYDHFYFNLGVNAGAAFLRGGNYVEYIEGAVSASGIAVGVHAGCSYDFYKGLCAHVQAGITDAIMNASTIAGTFNVVMFPVTVGLHYKLHLHRPKGPAPAVK